MTWVYVENNLMNDIMFLLNNTRYNLSLWHVKNNLGWMIFLILDMYRWLD